MNTKAKILIADDSAFMRKILIDVLTTAGFSTFIECSNGTEALAKYASEKPDLCLFDIVMPEMTGLDVLKKIGKEANALVISAVGQESMIDEAKQNGAKGYIVKPFDNKQVLEELAKVI